MTKNPLLMLAVCLLSLSGCQTSDVLNTSSVGDKVSTARVLPDVSFYRDDQLVATGIAEFKANHYGKSYALFKRAVEVFPHDAQAWLGYSASADMIGRFDNADVGYRVLAKLIPKRPEYLNNVGYSYLLRGNLSMARTYFLKAEAIDPGNATTADNLQLLRNSVSMARSG